MQTQETTSTNSASHKAHYSMKECIENCLNCFQACESAFVKGFTNLVKQDSYHLILLKSCADICQTSAKFMIMESPFHTETCRICATICEECADVFESMGDDHMKDCVEACRKCAASCGEMSQMGH